MTKKLLVVADLGHFKAYRLEESAALRTPRLRLLEDWETNVSDHLSEEVTDQAGQYRKGSVAAGPSDFSDGEEHHLETERRRRAVKKLAKRMDELLDREGAEECYFAAGSEINQAVLKELNHKTRRRIAKNVSANLTKLTPGQIIDHFCE